ncbi:MAG: hypothetical protein K0Q63_972, partial [Paenibacillus sp.]|nr:hypothetical protein [Paenibacillus sp.]
MPQIAKALLIIVGILALVVLAFEVHWLLGIGVTAGLLGYVVYANRTVWNAMRANAAYAQGDQEKALALMEKAYLSKRAKPLHNVNFAFLLMKAGKPEKAEQVLQEILRSESSTDLRMQAKSNLATAYWLLNRQEEAVALLEEVHREYKTVTVVGNLGYFKLLSSPPESALAFNEEAYAYDGDDLTIMDNLAQNYYLLRRLDEAALMYEKV